MSGRLGGDERGCPWCAAERGAGARSAAGSRVCPEHRRRLQAEARALVLAERPSAPAAE